MSSSFRHVLPCLFLGLLAASPMAAADQPPGVISTASPSESRDPAPLPQEGDEPWMPPSEALPNAIAQFDAVRERFTHVANLVYWETRRQLAAHCTGPGKGPDPFHLQESERYMVSKSLDAFPGMAYRSSPDGAFLIRQALTARLARPFDGMAPPAREEMRWGALLWMDLLPSEEQVDFLMIGFEALALSVDQASDAEWLRRGAETSPEAFAAFKHARLETAAATYFAERPDCGAVLHHVATGITRMLSRLPWEERGPRREAFAKTMPVRARIWALTRVTQGLEREKRLQAARSATADRRGAELTKEIQDLERTVARIEAQADREKRQAARNALEQKALREAENAPLSEDEQKRRDAAREDELARAEARRKLALEVEKQHEKAGLRAGGEGKEEKTEAKQALPVRWHPEARKEFAEAVNDKTRKRIDGFINNTLRLKGADLGMPQAQPVTGGEGIWELRPLGRRTGAWRPLYALVQGEFVILAFAPEFLENRSGFRKGLATAQKRRTQLLAEIRAK